MVGGAAVAVTTQTINAPAWFGEPVPSGVTQVQIMYDYGLNKTKVHWRTSDGESHSMEYDHTDEGVIAALIAMKLTC